MLLDFNGSTGFGTWRIFCSSLLGHLQTLLYFPIVLDSITFLSTDIITLFTLVLLRHVGGVIFCFYYYSVLPFVLL
jgi:hypothetical protein